MRLKKMTYQLHGYVGLLWKLLRKLKALRRPKTTLTGIAEESGSKRRMTNIAHKRLVKPSNCAP